MQIHTPMVMDLKKMNDDDSDEIDPQLIGSLMYLVNTRPDSCYAVNVLSQFMSQSRQTHEIAIKHVLRYIRGTVGYGLRYASKCGLEFAGICRYRLGREYSGLEENIRLLFFLGVCHGFLVQQETKLCGLEYHRSRVYSIECGSPRSSVASQASDKIYLIMRWILLL
jgi:hypothetical protein